MAFYMSGTSLNVKCGIEGSSFLQNFCVFDFEVLEPFPTARCYNETNTLKLEQLNHQVTFRI